MLECLEDFLHLEFVEETTGILIALVERANQSYQYRIKKSQRTL